MATITLSTGATTHPSRWANVRTPYLVSAELDWADAVTEKGSALAASDVIQMIDIPAGTVVLGAGAYVKTVGNATAATIDVGPDGDPDEWVNDLDVISAVTYGTDLSASPVWNTFGSANTIDVTIAALTGTLSTGKVIVYALLVDVSPNTTAGIALVGS